RVLARFPGPVRRGVVQAEEEGPLRFLRHALDVVHGTARDQVGEVAFLGAFLLAGPEVVLAVGTAVAEVVDAARHRSEELLVAGTQRAEMRRVAEVPLA